MGDRTINIDLGLNPSDAAQAQREVIAELRAIRASVGHLGVALSRDGEPVLICQPPAT